MYYIFDEREINKNRKIALLEKANENMTYAKEVSSKNMLCNCMCSENSLNIEIIVWLISGASHEQFVELCKKIIQVHKMWENVYHIFSTIVDNSADSFIMKAFENKIKDMDKTLRDIKDFAKLSKN